MNTSAPASTYELQSRVSDGLHVRLLWLTPDDRLFVTVTDSKHDQQFCVEVNDRGRALDVFHHPFAYASHDGAETNPTGPHIPIRVSASA
ncbi:MAG TPA: hypothetical protein VMJ65_02920 [Solirubrobacteraceae bacterium]|nr:hypothetical protein [Solirubrobacteraceae bacterium]